MAYRKKSAVNLVDQDAIARESLENFERIVKANASAFDPQKLKQKIRRLSPEDQERVAKLLANLQLSKKKAQCRLDFREFAKEMWPTFDGTPFYDGPHFRVLAEAFHRIDAGEPLRLIINIAPRRGKSRYTSTMFPAWFLGKHPEKSMIQVSNKTDLAEKFSGGVRDLIAKPEYQNIFPATSLRRDSKAKGDWRTTAGGTYYAAGVGAKVMGRGADVLIIDDPHSEQDTKTSGAVDSLPTKTHFDEVYNWFTSILPRVERGGSIIIVMQRLTPYDLTGRLMDAVKNKETADKWEVISLPALEPELTPDGEEVKDENGIVVLKSTWDFYSTESLLKLRASMPLWKWESQYQQNPKNDASSVIKRSYWKWWARKDDGTVDENKNQNPPRFEYIIQSWDTAGTANTRSNYSACTTWGVFIAHKDEKDRPTYNIFLLNAVRGKWEYPQLKEKIIDQYKKFKPDCVLVEKTSAGLAVVTDLPRAGVPIRPFVPRGNQYGLRGDKFVRVDAVADMFHSGMVWVPIRDWVKDVIEEFATFGSPGGNDDYVDSTTQALMRFREQGFIVLPSDEKERDDEEIYETVGSYY